MSEERINRLDGKVSQLETQSAKMQSSINSLVNVINDQGKVQNIILKEIKSLAIDSSEVHATKGMISMKSILTISGLFLTLIGIGLTMLTLATKAITSSTDLKIEHREEITAMETMYNRQIQDIKHNQLKSAIPHIGHGRLP